MILAVKGGSEAVAAYLLDRGANINITNKYVLDYKGILVVQQYLV